MKKYTSLLFAIIWMIIGSGCMLINHPTDGLTDTTSDELILKLLNAVESNNSVAIYDLFADAAQYDLGDMTQEATNLIEYLQGNDFTFKCVACPSERKDWEKGDFRKTETTSYEILSENQAYRLAMRAITADTAQPENVGIWSVSVIRADEDPRTEYPYSGDCTYRTGIFIGATFNPIIVGSYEKAGALSLETVTTLLDAVSRNDITETERQFAKDAIQSDEDFQIIWNELNQFFGCGYTKITLDCVESAISGLDDDGWWREKGLVSFLVTTHDGVHQIIIRQVYYNSANTNDVGIWSLKIN